MKRSALRNELSRLVLRARAGDHDAFGELFRQTHQSVYGMLWQMVGTEDESRDLAQEVYVEAWRSLHTLKAPEAFRTWLFRIAANKAKDHLKKRRVPTESLEDLLAQAGEAAEPADDESGPQQVVIDGERSQVVQDAVRSLSEEHKAVVAMHYIGGLRVSEVAKALGVPRGTVLSRLARARAVLKDRLSAYLEGEDDVQ